MKIEGVVGRSRQIHEILAVIHRVAPTGATVLLRGESGVGKEVFARAIHFLSPRAEGPFVTVNCAAIPENLLEAELFGYERGAFTGAVQRKKGKFELAEGGTLFLDEIGEPVKVDVRVIAATNRNLEEMMREGKFREDLYYRLNVVPIFIPPLRERKEDIPVLVYHFLDLFRDQYAKEVKIAPEVMDAFMRYPWYGNVRELRNVVERMVILDTDGILTAEDLPAELREEPSEKREPVPGGSLRDMERKIIEKTLRETGYVIKETARRLGMTPRQVSYRIRKYGIKLPR